jgi:phospholipid-translocating ATPase
MIAKASKFAYRPDDIDIVRAIRKRDPNFDFTQNHDGDLGIGLKALKRQQQRPSSITPTPSGRHSRAESTISVSTIEPPGRPSLDVRCASRTDMSTGIVSTDRGFNFSTEERGVAMKRMQSNLSERRIQSNRSLQKLPPHPEERKMSTLGHVFSLRRGLRKSLRRKPTDTAGRGSHDADEGEHHDGER